MIETFKAGVRLVVGGVLVVASTLLHGTPLLALAVVKVLLPIATVRHLLTRILTRIAESSPADPRALQ